MSLPEFQKKGGELSWLEPHSKSSLPCWDDARRSLMPLPDRCTLAKYLDNSRECLFWCLPNEMSIIYSPDLQLKQSVNCLENHFHFQSLYLLDSLSCPYIPVFEQYILQMMFSVHALKYVFITIVISWGLSVLKRALKQTVLHTHTLTLKVCTTYIHTHVCTQTQLNLYSDVFITVKTGDTYNTGWHSLQYMNIKHWNYITTITLLLTGGKMSSHCYFNHSGRPHTNFKQNSIEIYFNSFILCHVFNIIQIIKINTAEMKRRK